MKKKIDAFDYAGTICKALSRGVLLTTRRGDELNTMTIGWGKLGIEWGRPIFIAYVRDSRYSKLLLDETGEFTVNVPMDSACGEILAYCGRNSGRDTDKIRDLNLTTVASDVVAVPGIAQLPLTLECKVIYKQRQAFSGIPADIVGRYYPPFGQSGEPDIHTAYYGQIVGAYLIEE